MVEYDLSSVSLGYPLLLSTLSGLSTTIGACIAVSRKPDDSLLAFLLGTALGVMATVSIVELWIKGAVENNPWLITLSVVGGGAVFCLVHPLLPKGHEDTRPETPDEAVEEGQVAPRLGPGAVPSPKSVVSRKLTPGGHTYIDVHVAAGTILQRNNSQQALLTVDGVTVPDSTGSAAPQSSLKASRKDLLRLGLVMAATMTLHNLPEGFAVAFSAMTDFGVLMALAIAIHNIPEGVIIAAPLYAATGNRLRAVGLATASGLSEPLGALIALLVVRPFLDSLTSLPYILAFVGGIMLAVCCIELWPEGKACGRDKRLYHGIAAGVLVMGATLGMGM